MNADVTHEALLFLGALMLILVVEAAWEKWRSN